MINHCIQKTTDPASSHNKLTFMNTHMVNTKLDEANPNKISNKGDLSK